MDAFLNNLQSRQVGTPKNRSFLVKWDAGLYADYMKQRGVALPFEEIKRFMSGLAKTHEQWQLQQAAEAIRLGVQNPLDRLP